MSFKKKISLILPPSHQDLCMNKWTIRGYLFSIQAMLESKGYDVVLDDLLDEKDKFEQLICNLKEKISPGNIYCIVAFLNNRLTCLKFIDKLKAADSTCTTILCGPFARDFYAKIMEAYPVDFVVLREPEFTVLSLVCQLEGKGNPHSVNNIVYKKDNTLHNTPAKRCCNNDELPFVGPYFCINNSSPVSITTAFGCPYTCGFCDRRDIWVKKMYFRDDDNIVQEVEELNIKYKVRDFVFDDCNFVSGKKRIMDLCRKLIEKKLDIRWRCSTRVDSVSRDTLHLMRLAGCHTVYYGVESASQKILKNLGKRYTKETIFNAVKMTKAEGIKVGIFLMIGCPGENIETIRETKKLLARLSPFDELNVNPFIVLPGTALYDEFIKDNKITEDYVFQDRGPLFYISNWQEIEDEIRPFRKFFEICSPH